MLTGTTSGAADRKQVRELAWFTVVAFALGAVFYLVGPVIGSLSSVTRSNIPGTALAVVCPTIAALVLVRHHNSADLANWTLRLPTWSWWWILAVVAAPAVVLFTSLLAVDPPPAAPTLPLWPFSCSFSSSARC